MNSMIKSILLFVLISTNCFSQSDIDLVKNGVSQEAIEGHIYFLASDELKGRATGSPEIDIAAQYLATTMQRFGVQEVPGAPHYFQAVPMESLKPAQTLKVTLGDDEWTGWNSIIALNAENIDVKSEIVFVGYGSESDYQNKNVKDKIVLVKAGSKENQQPREMLQVSSLKRAVAGKFGAKALIELAPVEKVSWESISGFLSREKFGLGTNEPPSIPHVWLKDSGKQLSNSVSKINGKVTSLVIAGASNEITMSKNVVGMVEGTDPKLKDEFIIYSAHYDHIGLGEPNIDGDSIYNGARDNAVGVVTVLSAAENIAKNPTKRSALFILFTGEEKGLLGSSWYANNALIPLDKMVFCFNSDNASYNDTSVATIVGLERTTAANHIKNACQTFGLKALDDPAPEQNLFDRSDNVNFATKGVPAPTFSLGFTSFDAEVFKYYHQVTDNPESLDYEYLLKFFQSYVLACRHIANDPKRPFWVEGDKYYTVGKELYK